MLSKLAVRKTVRTSCSWLQSLLRAAPSSQNLLFRSLSLNEPRPPFKSFAFGVFIFLVCLAALAPVRAHAAITFGGLTSGECGEDGLLLTAPTITGSDTVLVIALSVNGGGEPLPSSATYNGVALGTPDVDSTRIDFVRTYAWLVPNPASAADLEVTPDAGCVGILAYYTGVDQATTFRTATVGEGTASPGSLSVTNSEVGDVIAGFFGTHDLAASSGFTEARMGAGQTFRAQVVDATDETHISFSDEPGSGSTVTHSWTYVDSGSSNWTGIAIPLIPSGTIEQEGFRWRDDDGDEDGASWLAAQDTDITRAANLVTRLRLLLNATDDPGSTQYQLEYQEDSATAWQKVISASGFPSVVDSATTQSVTGSSISVNMPTDIQAGELLLIFACNDNSATDLAISGWTELFDEQWGTGTSGTTAIVKHGAWAKIAAGSDTATLTGAAQDMAVVSMRITKHGVSTIATDIKVGTVATTTASATPNPPSLDAGSSKKWLWLESFGADDDDDTATYWSTSPAAYTGVAQIESNGASTTSCLTAVASLENETQTEDPGNMAMAASEEWIAQTIAIPPFVEQITLSASSNITASGENTTVQLAAPSGKSTSDFDAGRIQDDENPADAVDITTDDYTEMEWSVIAVNGVAQDGDVYEFRVTSSGTALDTYSVTPQWTIGTVGGGGGGGVKIIRLQGGRLHGVRLQ